MESDAFHTLSFASSPPPQLPQALGITDSTISGQENVANVSAADPGDRPTAAPTWLRRQELKRSTLPPPLNSVALPSQNANVQTTATRVTSASFDPEVHSSVAPPALPRLAALSAPVALPEPGGDAAAAGMSHQHPSAALQTPFKSRYPEVTHTPPLLGAHSGCDGGDTSLLQQPPSEDGGHYDPPPPTAGARVLPWWKRILVDAAYRQRLMQLSTEGYHEELRLLRDTPELLSSGAQMEVRKVWRERRWMDDELEKAERRPSKSDVVCQHEVHGVASGIATLSSSFTPYHVSTTESGAQQRHVATPMMDEVDEVVVMAQHVVFSVKDDEMALRFSTKHPRSIIDASAVETVQRVALGAMPPAQHAREQWLQEHAVRQHLTSLRRFSGNTSYELKARLARDVIAGRVDVPMQTAITDAVLNEQQGSLPSAGGSATTRRHALQDVYVFPPPQHSNSNAAVRQRRWCEGELLASTTPLIWQLPLRKPRMPTTPLWQRSRLPPGMWAVEAACKDVTRTEASLHASAVRDPLVVAKRPAAIKDSAEALIHHEGTPNCRETVATRAAAVTGAEPRHDNTRVRRQEAAAACVDGTENLYGLQYVWPSPLPPGGFIRVSPDPRFAMWPDSEDETGDGGLLGTMEKYGDSQARGLHAGDGGRINGDVGYSIARLSRGASQHQGRQAQMRRLARRVNHRTHKLCWLHSIGRVSVRYSDLTLSDSDGSSSGCTSPTASVLRDTRLAAEAKKANRKAPHLPMLPGDGNACRHQWRRQERVGDPSRRARPVYDGALNINIYAKVIQSQGNDVATDKGSSTGASPLRRASQHQHQQAKNAATTAHRFLGCYRQSRLLIHFKLYCRALYEERRLRCGGPGTHVIGRAGGNAPEYTPATEGLLAGVPVIPHPVLKLQEHAPSLRKPYAHRVPVASTMSGCRCWEGLYPPLGTDLAAPAQQAWRQLRQSILVRQALRDVYDELPHDKEGLLDKRTFVLFVLQLLELFFPTRLPVVAHIAIAEEEWTYRGTTEHVGPQTFHEKFFAFPLIFYRDAATLTEAPLVEFWTLIRVCFDAQKRMQKSAAPTGKSGDALQPSSLSLLMPLTHFTTEQLDTLLSCPPPAFDADVYDRYCLLRQAFRDDLKVRAAPRGHQYGVARALVEKRQQKKSLRHGHWTPQQRKSTEKPIGSLKVYRAHLGLADATRRIEIEAAAQQERDSRQRRLEEQEHEALLEQSLYYHARISRVQSRTATAISGIENVCSAWELHRTDVYPAPREDENDDARPREEEDVEELLLKYLDDVPLDAFDGQVSLRERYHLHVRFQQERRNHLFPSSQPRPEPSPSVTLADGGRSAALPSANPIVQTTSLRRRVKAESKAQRRTPGSAEARFLLDGTRDVNGGGGGDSTPPTVSYAAGTYPPRTVPRMMSPSRVRPMKGAPGTSSAARIPKRRAAHLSVSRVDGNGKIGSSSPFASFYATAASHWPHTRSPTARGIQREGLAASHREGGVSGLCPGKDDDDLLAATASGPSHTSGRNTSFDCKGAAAPPRLLARPTTQTGRGTPCLPVSPLLAPHDGDAPISCGGSGAASMHVNARRDASPLLQHSPPLMPATATSTTEPATTELTSIMFRGLGVEAMHAAPRSVPWISQWGSTMTQDVGARPLRAPALSTAPVSAPSASLRYAQRLRVQRRLQQQFKQQLNRTAKAAAGVAGNH
nr:unnamed protein product [Leishmania braziliensis]